MELWDAKKVAEETGMSVTYSQKLIKNLMRNLRVKDSSHSGAKSLANISRKGLMGHEEV